MSFELETRVYMSIDLKKYRLRLHKACLHLLGDPEYIQILVNPKEMAVVIRSVDRVLRGDQTHKVNQKRLKSTNSVEIYSRIFVQKLCQEIQDIEAGSSYRLTGEVIPAQRIAVFSLREFVEIRREKQIDTRERRT